MMALIHENLYKSKDLSGIDASAFLQDTVAHLSSYIIDSDKIVLKADIGKASLDIDNAIPCGLIVNELVTNAVKYAFPPEAIRARGESFRGEIVVSLHPDDGGGYRLSVADNGVGIPEGLASGKSGSLGLQLVKGLVAQIHGKLKVERSEGTAFIILFGESGSPRKIT
jgi:two-component sensor histidine kinase